MYSYLQNFEQNKVESRDRLTPLAQCSFVEQNNAASSLRSKQNDDGSIICPSQEFSFSKMISFQKINSIRNDLIQLPKNDMIDILMGELQQNKLLRLNITDLEEQLKIKQQNTRKNNSSSTKIKNQDSFNNYYKDEQKQMIQMEKYKELVEYMEEYMNNTNQAQNHFMRSINRLKEENMKLKDEMKEKVKNKHYFDNCKQKQTSIQNLQQSLKHYMEINNQLTKQFDKLKYSHELLLNQYESQKSKLSLSVEVKQGQVNKLNLSIKEYKDKMLIMEICNSQLKQTNQKMEKIIEGKSEKIRKLLEELEALSEQKWKYKQLLMELKTKQKTSAPSSIKSYHPSSNKVSEDSVFGLNYLEDQI